jgi:hypothetical protein
MKIYKFKDTVDGKYAFIIAENEAIARAELDKKTSLYCKMVDFKSLEDYNKPIILKNDILPF